MIFNLTDGNAETTIHVDSLQEAREAAVDWLRDGDWAEVRKTFWVDCYINDEDGERLEKIKVSIDPDEPGCEDDKAHNWQSPIELVGGIKENPGVWGHGGGVIITEVCMNCMCRRITDTWAQDMNTGEQGLTSIKYSDSSEYDDALSR